MAKLIKSVKHYVSDKYNYIVHRVTEFEDGSKTLQVAHVMDSLTPEMMSSTSFDWIDSPETSTYWQKTVSDQESIQEHLAYYHDNDIVTGKTINDLVKTQESRADKVATNIVSGFGDKTINVSEGFYNWLIETARYYAGDDEYGSDADIKVIDKMLHLN